MESSTLFGPNSSFSIAFNLFGLDIYWYAILSILGYFTAIIIFLFVSSKRYKVSYEVPFYYIFIALPVILLGARFWSCIIGDAQFSSFFNFREGGLAVQGGVIFGAIAGIIYFPLILRSPKYHLKVRDGENTYIMRPSIWLYADAIIPTILLGQAIGRWGNFFNGEIFGRAVEPSQLEWLKNLMPGVYDHMTPAIGITVNGISNGQMYFQPLFLYESFLNIVTFIVIYLVLANFYEFKAGTICSLYFVGYGIIRFITESMRDTSFTFVATYVINTILFIMGIIMFILCEWVLPRYRQYKYFAFLKSWVKSNFHQTTQKPKLNDLQFQRSGSQLIYYANR